MPTLIEQEDPFLGFSGMVKVFQREGPIYRTQPATRGMTFNDQSFLAEKPANGLRIFCLGGSSSFGFPWGAEAAFTSIVGEALAATHPERQVEAVNASGVSYAMHRLNIVADELLAYKPDVFLVYSGHNEFIEPAFFDALKHRSTLRTRLEYALSYSRVYSGMRLGRTAPAEFSTFPRQRIRDAGHARPNARLFSGGEGGDCCRVSLAVGAIGPSRPGGGRQGRAGDCPLQSASVASGGFDRRGVACRARPPEAVRTFRVR